MKNRNNKKRRKKGRSSRVQMISPNKREREKDNNKNE